VFGRLAYPAPVSANPSAQDGSKVMFDEPARPEPASPPDAFAGTVIGRRLYRVVSARFETGETAIAWSRAWVSRDGRASSVIAARHRDFVVVTDRRVMLWSCGFFTRRPRRRVLTDRRDDLRVVDIGSHPRRRLRVRAFARKPLRFEFGSDARSRAVVDELLREVQE
jgi:hypothetical protein